ncbi:MAG: hypothetical protein Q9227_002200 [Pyrenula ochraceoflavens]
MAQTSAKPLKVSELTSQEAWESFILYNQQNNSYVMQAGPRDCKAPASKVFATLTDSSTWKDWSSFVPKIEVEPPSEMQSNGKESSGTLEPGAKLHFGVVMNPEKPKSFMPSHLIVDKTCVPKEKGEAYYVTWSTIGMPHWLHFGQRVWKIEDLDDGASRLTTYEFQRGPMVWPIKFLYIVPN